LWFAQAPLYILGMNERELIERLGLPDAIVGPEDRIRSSAWICFGCGETTITPEPIACPAPCWRCGGIMFETWKAPCPEIPKGPKQPPRSKS
jgi:hypothetical protein